MNSVHDAFHDWCLTDYGRTQRIGNIQHVNPRSGAQVDIGPARVDRVAGAASLIQQLKLLYLREAGPKPVEDDCAVAAPAAKESSAYTAITRTRHWIAMRSGFMCTSLDSRTTECIIIHAWQLICTSFAIGAPLLPCVRAGGSPCEVPPLSPCVDPFVSVGPCPPTPTGSPPPRPHRTAPPRPARYCSTPPTSGTRNSTRTTPDAPHPCTPGRPGPAA